MAILFPSAKPGKDTVFSTKIHYMLNVIRGCRGVIQTLNQSNNTFYINRLMKFNKAGDG
jgi:hypothetical protein